MPDGCYPGWPWARGRPSPSWQPRVLGPVLIAVSASSSFYYCGALAPAPAQIQTSLISVSGYPSRQSSRHGDDKTACAPNGLRQRLARPRGTPVRRIAPLGRQAGLPRAMALPRAALGHPFSPCHARPGFRLSTSTTGSGPSFAYSRTQHPGEQSRSTPFRSRAVCPLAQLMARAFLSLSCPCSRWRAAARVPQNRGDGEARRAHGEPQGQEPTAAEEGRLRCPPSGFSG
jgi:hypothetical protein